MHQRGLQPDVRQAGCSAIVHAFRFQDLTDHGADVLGRHKQPWLEAAQIRPRSFQQVSALPDSLPGAYPVSNASGLVLSSTGLRGGRPPHGGAVPD